MRIAWIALLLCAVAHPTLPAAHADDLESEQAKAIEALHAFGVRGLRHAYKGAASAGARPKAIQLGLEWLAAHQSPNGGWEASGFNQWCHGKAVEDEDRRPDGLGKGLYDPGVTGMSVAAFLGAGYTHRGKHPFAKVVARALRYLEAIQGPEGCFGPRRTQQYIYNHAFASLALVEAFALTGDENLRESAQKAIDFSTLARNPKWAWRYGIKPGDNDTSVTGCIGTPLYLALRLNRACERAGLLAPLALDDTMFAGVRLWVDKVVDPVYGSAGYLQRGTGPARPRELVEEFPGEKSESCTAITVFLRLVLPGFERTPDDAKQSRRMVEKGAKLMLGLRPAWAPGKGTIDLYYWYYATMAMHEVGGDAWRAWDDALATALLNSQHREGDACYLRGSWDPIGPWGPDGGRCYSTALCLLMLETPDRLRRLPPDRGDLLTALRTPDLEPRTRASVLRGLGLLRVPKSGPEVVKWVRHDDAGISAAAAASLEHLEVGSGSVRTLARLLSDRRLRVRRAAVRALVAQGSRLRPALTALVARLGDADVQVAAFAARALGNSKVPEVADELRPRMKDAALELRVAAAVGVYTLTRDTTATLPALLAGLGAKRADVRLEAARTLERMGLIPASPPKELVDALVDPVHRVRIHAAGALFHAGQVKDACLGAWISALDAPDGRDRLLAMQHLEGAPTPRATPKLAAQLFTGAPALRVQAARTLGAAGPAARKAAAELCWCCVNGSTALRTAASDAYAALALDPQSAAAVLLPLFEVGSKDRRVLEGAARALVLQGAPIVAALVGKLTQGEPQLQAHMLGILGRLGAAAAAAVPAVARELRTAESVDTRRRAAAALGAIGPPATAALPQLREALDDSNPRVGWAALQTIGKLALHSDEAVRLLTAIGGDIRRERSRLRTQALRAIALLGKRGVPAIPTLLKALQDPDRSVRRRAVDALVGLWPHSESQLLKSLRVVNTMVRHGVAQVVVRVGEPAKKLARPLANLIAEGEFTGETVYGNALIAIGKPAVSVTMKLLRSKTAQVRREASRVLGEIGPPAKRALSALKRLLEDSDDGVRQAAAHAIKEIRKGR